MLNNNISFILHKPQLSENIGACARAMKNFNFQKMIVVDPKYLNDIKPSVISNYNRNHGID